jgi:hypothetical protein
MPDDKTPTLDVAALVTEARQYRTWVGDGFECMRQLVTALESLHAENAHLVGQLELLDHEGSCLWDEASATWIIGALIDPVDVVGGTRVKTPKLRDAIDAVAAAIDEADADG